MKLLPRLAALVGAIVLSPSPWAAEYSLAIQPVQSPEKTAAAYQPLAAYLSAATGQDVRLLTSRNFVAYWQTMKTGQFDLVLDAAHFTDYRIQKMKYAPLVKVADVVSFALVTREDMPVLEPRELIGKRLASPPSPGMGYVSMSEMFPNPLRQPIIVTVDDAEQAVALVQEGEVAAAVVPTPLVSRYPFLYTVQTTRQTPHMALSAAPRVPQAVREAIRRALLEADKTPQGREMLKQVKLERFEAASARQYEGFGKMLEGVFGY